MELELRSGDTACDASGSTRLIVLHLPTLNQLRLPLNLFQLDDGPLFRGEGLDLRFQIREEVTLRPDQRSEEIFVVVKPSVLSRCGLDLLRVDYDSKLELGTKK